jgi:hypothetical protein
MIPKEPKKKKNQKKKKKKSLFLVFLSERGNWMAEV